MSVVGVKRTLAMAECDVEHVPASKLYAFGSWCSTCSSRASSRRRRTMSDTFDTCRRHGGREVKAFAPLEHRRWSDVENWELDVEMEYEVHDVRYDRVRSNLCELNCQLHVSLTTSDYLDAKIPSDYERHAYVVNAAADCSTTSPTVPFDMPNDKPPPRRLPPAINGKRIAGQPPPARTHCSANVTIIEPMLHRTPPPQQQRLRSPALPRRTPPPRRSTPVPPSPVVPRPIAPSLHMRHERLLRRPFQDTSILFEKHFDAKAVRERYAQELEVLRDKLRDLHNHKYKQMRSAHVHKNQEKAATRALMGSIYPPPLPAAKQSEDAPHVEHTKRADSIITLDELKARHDAKLLNRITLKTNKVRISSARSSKSRILKSAPCKILAIHSSSSNDDDKKGEVSTSSIPSDSPERKEEFAQTAALKTSLLPDHGDAPSWPVRYSLFPNIPPYVKFSMHDEQPNVLPASRRYMKWKLSTITPVVVRKTLINTGFRMVRIEEDPEQVPPHLRMTKLFGSEFSCNVFTLIAMHVLESNDWTGTWGKHMKSPMFKTLRAGQKLNHFAGTFQLGRKDRLWKNVQRLIHRYGQREFGFIPQTFVLPHDLKLLKQCWECKDGSGGEKWIVKPPASARGVGIRVINKWSQLPKQGPVVVQKYIANPYLINGSKFDLRLYVLVTSFHPLRIYLYPEGLVRFASVKYTDNEKDLKDKFMHLTNYSINKLSSQYTANEDANACQGHKWTLTKLWEYLADRHVDTAALWETLTELVIKTMIAGESPITQLCAEYVTNRYNCYELFGVDVLLDEVLKPWLLEVNISPSLHSTSPLDLHVKGPLVQTLFNLAQFHLPTKIGRMDIAAPACYDPRLYTTLLTPKEANKQNYFMQMERRFDYVTAILDHLTGDDVRVLTQAEDELVVKSTFERIFPTANTFKYLDFIPVRYYNRLFDAWEGRYEKRREDGIQRLRALCAKRIHQKVQPQPVSTRKLPSTSHGSSTPSMDAMLDPDNVVINTELKSTTVGNQRPSTSPISKKTDV